MQTQNCQEFFNIYVVSTTIRPQSCERMLIEVVLLFRPVSSQLKMDRGLNHVAKRTGWKSPRGAVGVELSPPDGPVAQRFVQRGRDFVDVSQGDVALCKRDFYTFLGEACRDGKVYV